MNQQVLTQKFEDAILSKLPDEAIDQLDELLNAPGDDKNAEIAALLEKYGIDPQLVAKEIIQQEGENHD